MWWTKKKKTNFATGKPALPKRGTDDGKYSIQIKQDVTASGRSFSVSSGTAEPALLYKFVSSLLTLRKKMKVLNSADHPVAIVQRQLVSNYFRKKFQIFLFTPNRPGQPPADTYKGVPYYRFAYITRQYIASAVSAHPVYTLRLYDGNNKAPSILLKLSPIVDGIASATVKKKYSIQTAQGKVVGSDDQTSALQLSFKNTYNLSLDGSAVEEEVNKYNIKTEEYILACIVLAIVADVTAGSSLVSVAENVAAASSLGKVVSAVV